MRTEKHSTKLPMDMSILLVYNDPIGNSSSHLSFQADEIP